MREEGIFLIADDLTGACDSAGPLARQGLRSYVGLHADALPPAGWQVFASNTNSRSVAKDVARQRVQAASRCSANASARMVLKKVDSLMRGNVEDELITLQQSRGAQTIVLAPGYPALGRTVEGGMIFAPFLDTPIAIAEALPQFRCLPVAASELHHRMQGRDPLVLIPDTRTEEEMKIVADCCAATSAQDTWLLWACSAGLTTALAAGLAKPPPSHDVKIDGPLLACIGSRHPVTLAQLSALSRQTRNIFPAHGRVAIAREAMLRGEDAVLLLDRELPDATIPWESCGALFLSGGDTAQMVLASLKAESICLQGEWLPGIPFGKLVGGDADGVMVITKSGAFGGEHTLVECLACVARHRVNGSGLAPLGIQVVPGRLDH